MLSLESWKSSAKPSSTYQSQPDQSQPDNAARRFHGEGLQECAID
jgi:hypothetical protein